MGSTAGRRGIVRVAAACFALVLVGTGTPVAAQDAPDDVKTLVAQLADPAARGAAADALARRGADAVPALIVALDDPALRERACEVIERVGEPAKAAVPALTGVLKGPWNPARSAAVRAAGSIGADAAGAVPALAAIVGQPPRVKDRVDAVNALGRILTETGRRFPRAPSDVDPLIAAGCDWLLRHQSADGRWDADKFGEKCPPGTCTGPGQEYDIGLTALATLALLGARGAPEAPRAARADRAIEWLRSRQTGTGEFGRFNHGHAIYDHGCATLAVAEACRTRRDPALRASVEKAVQTILRLQHVPTGGWTYVAGSDHPPDTSVTTWIAWALWTASDAGIAVDPKGLSGALRCIDIFTGDAEHEWRTGYYQKGGPSARTTVMQPKFPASLSLATTSCSLFVRLRMETPDAPDIVIAPQAALVSKLPPKWDRASGCIDLYYWMFASQAMRLRGVGTREYRAWRRALVDALRSSQLVGESRCERGSWDPVDPWSIEGGRVYMTAMALLALEACDVETLPPVPGVQGSGATALVRATTDKDRELAAAARRAVASIRPYFQF